MASSALKSNGARLRFGPYELDLRAYRLTKHGVFLRLRPQALRVLVLLAEDPGALIPRQQLKAELWPEETFVDFDHGVNKAINLLREVLCDSAESPRYIETVPKEGYRFIAEVEVLPPTVMGNGQSWSDPQIVASTISGRSSEPRSGNRLLLGWALASVALVVALGATVWLMRPRPIPFEQRDWVLVTDFENRTGDPELDGVPSRLVRDLLAESQHVNVVAGGRIQDTLLLMRRPAETKLDVNTAREVAQRDGGIRLLIGGELDRVGEAYRLSLHVIQPATGVVLARFAETEDSKEDLLRSIEGITGRLRRRLGETAPLSPEPQLQRVTTRSLKALKLYSQGVQKLEEGFQNLEAIPLLQGAVAEEPDFASAHIYLAHAFANRGETDKAWPHFETAFKLAHTVPEAERLFIESTYYRRKEPDRKRGKELLERLVAAYPDHYWGWNNLYVLRREDGDDRALEAAQHLVQIRPNSLTAAMYLIWALDSSGRSDERDAIRRKWEPLLQETALREKYPSYAAELQHYSVWDLLLAGKVPEGKARLDAIVAEARTRGPKYRRRLNFTAGITYFLYLGRRHDAVKALADIAPEFREYTMGDFAQWAGRPDLARDHYMRASRERFLVNTVIGLARTNAPGEARRQFAALAPDLEPEIQRPWLEAEVLRAEGQLSQSWQHFLKAVEVLRQRQRKAGYWTWRELVRGYALLLEQRGQLQDAIAVLEEGLRAIEKLPDRALEVELMLLRLYVRAGKWDRVEQLVGRIGPMLVMADADHPFVLQLESVKQAIARNQIRRGRTAIASRDSLR